MIEKNDILNEVEIYLSYGKSKEAVNLLQEGIRKYPSRVDLKKRLHEIIETESVSESENTINITIHRFAYYVLFVFSMLFVVALISNFVKYFGFYVYLPESFAILFSLFILFAVIFTVSSVFLFCLLWFKYIEFFSENKYLYTIEKNLDIHKLEPIYSFVKMRIYKINT